MRELGGASSPPAPAPRGRLVLDKGLPGETYNVGSGDELSNLELTGLLLEACGAGCDQVEYVTDRAGHERRYSVDTAKISALGFRPSVPLAAGLAATVGWYRDNRSWWEPLRAVPQMAR